MEIIQIPPDATRMISTSSKGDQSKWRIGDKWVKQNARGYEGQAEILASLVLSCTYTRTGCIRYLLFLSN